MPEPRRGFLLGQFELAKPWDDMTETEQESFLRAVSTGIRERGIAAAEHLKPRPPDAESS